MLCVNVLYGVALLMPSVALCAFAVWLVHKFPATEEEEV